jgi:hypothetical protein
VKKLSVALSSAALATLVAAQSIGLPARAQSAKPTENSAHALKGSISGRVFLITKAGDLKPARFAKVYLINGWTGNKNHESALSAYLARSVELYEARTKSSIPTEAVSCDTDLLTVADSVAAAAKWAEDNKKYSAVQSTETDEDGAFRVSGIRLDIVTGEMSPAERRAWTSAGAISQWNYKLVVLGRAGANEAYWEADVAFIQTHGHNFWRVETEEFVPGQDISIKLSSPKTACLKFGD